MKIKKHITVVLILFVSLNIFINICSTQFNNFSSDNYGNNDFQLYNPKVSDGLPLSYFAIDQNATTIYRLFESVNFTIDTTGYSDADHANIQIDFSNGSTRNYNMLLTAVNEYSYLFQPRYNAPLGFQNVSFLIYNNSNTLLNAHTTYTNFTIKTNYMAITNSTEVYIGEHLNAEITVNDLVNDSNPITKFGWNVTIVNSTIDSKQANIFNFEFNTVQFTYLIDNETYNTLVDHTFYIKLNMTDLISGKKAAAYYPFKVLNSNPIIDASSVSFSPTTVLRAEDCEITLNVTDVEDLPQNLDVTIDIEDPNGNFVKNVEIDYNFNNNFSKVFSIPPNSPIGQYKITINAEDQNGGTESYITSLSVKNNKPEIHGYKINGRSSNQGLSISYGKDLSFTFNVSDVESVAYIKVALLDENNEWYNITTDYNGIDTKITIRTIELITGVWYVYIYVIDHDGAITSLIDDYDMAPQAITIIPDALSAYLPWIIFFVGMIIGILVSIGLAFRYYKHKIRDTQSASPKKEDISSKKVSKKKEDVEKQSEVLPEIEKHTDETSEKKEESASKRKIKRKL